MMRVDLSVGALAPTLAEQMTSQGLALDEHYLHHFELDRKAIGRLSVRGMLSMAERDRAAKRLLKSIAQKAKSLRCTCGATCQDIGGGRCRYEANPPSQSLLPQEDLTANPSDDSSLAGDPIQDQKS